MAEDPHETARQICERLNRKLDRMMTSRELRAWGLLIVVLIIAWTAIILAYG
jgi:hypothetical protein